MTPITIRRKAFAYITSGTRLLLFTHPLHPEAGIQVPAGSMEPGETPVGAVLREAREETGLTTLRLDRWLGRRLASFNRHHGLEPNNAATLDVGDSRRDALDPQSGGRR